MDKSIKNKKFPQMKIFLQTESMELLLNIRDSSDVRTLIASAMNI